MSGRSGEDLDVARREAIATVYSRSPGALFVSFLNAALIVLVLEDGPLARGPFVWLALIALLTIVRASSYARYRSDRGGGASSAYWARASVVGALLAGLLWGAGPFIAPGTETAHQWLWAFAIGGMCAGAASLHAAHLPTALSFIFPAALPLAISLLFEETLQGSVAAIMTIAFICLTTFTAVLFSRDFRRMQTLRIAVEARAAEAEDVNRRLSREMADHKSTSEALYQSQKMEALGSLTGGFAHDFNNILTVVIGNLDLIAAGGSDERRRELVGSTIAAAESGADLISRLLAFARKQTLTPWRCDVVAAMSDFQKLIQHAVSGHIAVRFDYAVQSAIARVDVAQLQAVLLNLVVNARDAMPDGGTITISVAQVALDGATLAGTDCPPGEFIAICVEDDGVGMAPGIAERAFEPFFTTKGEGRGTGLGLAQVYGFARQSGGFGRIESRLGEGCRVTVFVPVDASGPGDAQDEDAPHRLLARDGGLSVMLVDDNLAVLRSLEDGLTEEGWAVRSVTTAEEAIAIVEGGQRLDIVVTDIDMPGGMNGLALARRMRDGFALPVLLMSGAPTSSETEGAGFATIAKPFRKAHLVQRILEAVGDQGAR